MSDVLFDSDSYNEKLPRKRHRFAVLRYAYKVDREFSVDEATVFIADKYDLTSAERNAPHTKKETEHMYRTRWAVNDLMKYGLLQRKTRRITAQGKQAYFLLRYQGIDFVENDFKVKTAIITGASGYIGSRIATLFAHKGYQVIVQGRHNNRSLEKLTDKLNSKGFFATPWQGDIDSYEGAEQLVDTCKQSFGNPDCLINNAGVYPVDDLEGLDEKKWQHVMNSNLTSAVMMSRASAKLMKKGSAIVNIASIEAHAVFAGHIHYAASKAGLLAATRNLAHALGPKDITVNAVSPGLIGKRGLKKNFPEGYKAWQARAALRRVGKPEDVAHACLFFCGPDARWITGSELVVDGGMQAASLI